MLFIKLIQPLLNFYSICYFWIVHYIFSFRNLFIKWRSVDPPDNNLLLLSATKAAEFIRSRELKSLELVEAYIQRITQVNEDLNAMVLDNFDAAREAALKVDDYLDNLDETSEEYENLSKTTPLLGVPFTVKNNIFVENFICTSGVPARLRSKPCNKDAEAVSRLHNAGAILLGVTNVPELGLWWETSNRIFGITRNPYDLRRTSGGSSGGEGALLGAAASLIGLGNDIGGSLRIPPSFCGVFGLKPGPGVVPSDGAFPEVKGGYLTQMATAGPMCRYAQDLSIFLEVLVGYEFADKQLRLNEPVHLKDLRFFYMEGMKTPFCEPIHADMRAIVRKVAKYFEKKYDKTSHRIDLILVHHALEIYFASFDDTCYPKITKSLVNFEYDLNCYVELIKHFFGYSEHTLPALITGIHSTLPKPSSKLIGFVESKRDQLRREIIDLLGDNGVLIFPAHPTTAPFVNQALLTPFNFIYNGLWSALALPSLVCPMGLGGSEDLPYSVQLVASPNQERLLLACARDLEDGFGGWVAPTRRGRFY